MTASKTNRLSGMPGLAMALAGQAIFMSAFTMVGVAISIWIFEQTGNATTLGSMLADNVMETAMQSSGGLSHAFGWLTGTGPGSGMAVMMVVFGILTILALMSGYVFPQIRKMEDILPDHDQLEKVLENVPS